MLVLGHEHASFQGVVLDEQSAQFGIVGQVVLLRKPEQLSLHLFREVDSCQYLVLAVAHDPVALDDSGGVEDDAGFGVGFGD